MAQKKIINQQSLNTPRPIGIIFDFNGVLVDDYPIQKEAWSQISRELRGQMVTDGEMVHRIRGVPSKETIKWLSGNKMSTEEIEKLAKKKDQITEHLCRTSPLFHLNIGLEEFLNQVQDRNIPRTIATSSAVGIFSFSFKKLRLDQWFNKQKILYNDGRHKGKPAPDPYLLAAKIINLKPVECLVIEDAKSGIQSAFAAGVRNIIVIGNDERLKVLGSLPGVVKTIHNFTELKVAELFD
ncbi:MAG TPA: HAD family phosphatase [Candidatus Bathyarchaeia archaeon]|nr:HAD family phosphatase [Candidatus Bathyarchaeia archaeon]